MSIKPEKPIPVEHLQDKFFHLSAPVLGKKGAGHLYDTILHVEELKDLDALSAALVPSKK